ncbi:hypothetical protein GCM10009555_064430 [Acrocarpospora macrocephala]|uniref:Uncharacterized protein n=1 Tax=Acrocarpospora macrocephala TaxID=150177 RepID=A0A5M3WHL6_9ACTN|nr:hypothetical protein Amac_012170 [Acrocarpospora macrocephala]
MDAAVHAWDIVVATSQALVSDQLRGWGVRCARNPRDGAAVPLRCLGPHWTACCRVTGPHEPNILNRARDLGQERPARRVYGAASGSWAG